MPEFIGRFGDGLACLGATFLHSREARWFPAYAARAASLHGRRRRPEEAVMYGDTGVIRALARQLRDRGHAIRSEADDLLGRAEAVAWSGMAADAMRRVAAEHARGLRACADAHDAAADALERHAREVDDVKELIAEAERRVLHLLDSLSGVVGHWLHHFDPPPHGSREWLDVRLPRWA
jgi:hypothetical protein